MATQYFLNHCPSDFHDLFGFHRKEFDDLVIQYRALNHFKRGSISAECSLLMGMVHLRHMPSMRLGALLFRAKKSSYHKHKDRAIEFLMDANL